MSEANLVVLGQPTHRYRYTEECLYPGDPLFVVGWASRVQPTDRARDDAEANESDDEEGEGEGEVDEEQEDVAYQSDDHDQEAQGPPSQLDRVSGLGSHLQKPGPGRGPLLVSALSREATVALHRRGVFGAGLIAMLVLAGVVWLLVARAS